MDTFFELKLLFRIHDNFPMRFSEEDFLDIVNGGVAGRTWDATRLIRSSYLADSLHRLPEYSFPKRRLSEA